MSTKNSENSVEKFYCEKCDYKCTKMQHWKQHLATQKHKVNNVANSVNKTINKKVQCECGKVYSDRSGLWRHKPHCKMPSPFEEKLELTSNLVLKLIEQNRELQHDLMEQNKTIVNMSQNNSYNNSYNNCGNKTFNLQFFLNETCKNAINMSDFVDQIQVSLDELENTGVMGYAEGISRVFIKNLNEIEHQERPIHCSDSKREIIYIKDENKWKKDDENKTSLIKAIKQVACKNMKTITDWQNAHPRYKDPESKENEKYMKIVLNSMSGSTKEESEKNYEKIAKKIAKEVAINKIL